MRGRWSAMRRRTQVFILVVLLLAGFAMRLAVADRAIWFDERFTLTNTQSVSAAVEHCLKDVHPPLYFVLVATWRHAFAFTEFSLRLLSLIFGMLSLVGVFLVGRAIRDWWAGIAALSIAAMSPLYWLYSTELRPYSMLLAFSAFATWAFLCAMKTGRLRYYILLAIFSALSLYTHYFAVFLLLAQVLVFSIVTLRNSVRGEWSPAHRNRLILYGVLSLVLVAIAYAPWAAVLRRVVTESIVDGRVVGAGRRLGRGVTTGLVWNSLYDSMGQGPIPFLLQAALVVWACMDRKLRAAAYSMLMIWAVPFAVLAVWRPAHFIAPKYFMFAYPMTVGMAGAGVSSVAEVFGKKGLKSARIFWPLLLAASLSPLLPGQHKPYAFHRSDWRDVVTSLEAVAGEGDRLSFPADPKTYAMVMHYAHEDLLREHPVILWRRQEGGERFNSLPPGSTVWFLKHRELPPELLAELAGEVERLTTWRIYPDDVSLYRFTTEGAGAAPLVGEEEGAR